MDNFVKKVVFLYLHEYVFFCNYMRVELCRSERRKKLLIACGLIAVFLAYCFASPFVVSAIKKEKSKSLTIVVDAGHGGEDGGVKGAKRVLKKKHKSNRCKISGRNAMCMRIQRGIYEKKRRHAQF